MRYLAQGNVALVREALHERTTLLHNAPHLAQPLAFVMPSYKAWEKPFYGLGLKMYDALAGKAGLGAIEFLSRKQALACLPTARPDGLKGGVKYWDGQFDDARLALALARTAATRGALLVNYCAATGLLHDQGKVTGLACRDAETGQPFEVRARCVINATGVWVDDLRKQDAAQILEALQGGGLRVSQVLGADGRPLAFTTLDAGPDGWSVIAQAPTLSRVRRSRAQRSFCSVVPFERIAALVRPTLTPIAVTMPGQWRQSSMIGIRVAAAWSARAEGSAAPPPFFSRGRPFFSASICLRKRARASSSMPKAAYILRRIP